MHFRQQEEILVKLLDSVTSDRRSRKYAELMDYPEHLPPLETVQLELASRSPQELILGD